MREFAKRETSTSGHPTVQARIIPLAGLSVGTEKDRETLDTLFSVILMAMKSATRAYPPPSV